MAAQTSLRLVVCIIACAAFGGPATVSEDGLTAVSVAPSLTELVFALGLQDHLVGRSAVCNYPPEVESVPVVGDFGRPNVEVLIRMRPTFLLCTDLEKPQVAKLLASYGIRTLLLPCNNWEELLRAGQEIAAALGHEAAGRHWRDKMEARRREIEQRVKARSNGRRSTVYVEIWSDPPLTAGRRSFLTEVVEMAGGRNIGANVNREYFSPSMEWVVRNDPDFILLTRMEDRITVVDRLGRRPGWNRLRALREGRVIADLDPDLLLRPGPRILDAVQMLSDRILP